MLNFSKIETQQHVQELFLYNKDTGIFTVRKKPHPTYNKRIGDAVGYKSSTGYLIVRYNKRLYQLHRLAFLYVDGVMPKMVDHSDHDRTNNRWENILKSSHQENGKNQSLCKNNTSGVMGVGETKSGKHSATIYIKNKRISLGVFTKKEDAISARKHAEKIYGFSKNHGK